MRAKGRRVTEIDLPFKGNVLFVSAHPDDEVSYAMAISLLTKRRPENVFVLTATSGESSTRGAAVAKSGGRLKELEKVYDSLKVSKSNRFYSKLPDAKLHESQNTRKLADFISRIVKFHGLQTLVTPGPAGLDGHSDHIAVHESTMLAVSEMPESRATTIWGADISGSDLSLKVDLNFKKSLLRIHRSQFPDAKTINILSETEPYKTLMRRESYGRYEPTPGYQPRKLILHIPKYQLL